MHLKKPPKKLLKLEKKSLTKLTYLTYFDPRKWPLLAIKALDIDDGVVLKKKQGMLANAHTDKHSLRAVPIFGRIYEEFLSRSKSKYCSWCSRMHHGCGCFSVDDHLFVTFRSQRCAVHRKWLHDALFDRASIKTSAGRSESVWSASEPNFSVTPTLSCNPFSDSFHKALKTSA